MPAPGQAALRLWYVQHAAGWNAYAYAYAYAYTTPTVRLQYAYSTPTVRGPRDVRVSLAAHMSAFVRLEASMAVGSGLLCE